MISINFPILSHITHTHTHRQGEGKWFRIFNVKSLNTKSIYTFKYLLNCAVIHAVKVQKKNIRIDRDREKDIS